MGYSIPKPPIKQQRPVIGYHGQNGLIGNSGYPGVPYIDFVSNNIDKAISYTEHITEKMDESRNYVEYLTEKIGGIHTKNPIRTVHLIPNIDLVPEPGFISQTPHQEIIKESEKLNWWCEKNKTSSDFWKYKL